MNDAYASDVRRMRALGIRPLTPADWGTDGDEAIEERESQLALHLLFNSEWAAQDLIDFAEGYLEARECGD